MTTPQNSMNKKKNSATKDLKKSNTLARPLWGVLSVTILFFSLLSASHNVLPTFIQIPIVALRQQVINHSENLGFLKFFSKVTYHLPAWIPLWHINMPSGIIDRRLPTIEKLRHDAEILLPLLEDLKQHRFFRIFKTDLSKECPFWARREMCVSGNACHICECDEQQVPEAWKEKPTENFVDRSYYNTDEEIQPWGAINTDTSKLKKINGINSKSSPFNQHGFHRVNGFPSVSDEHSTAATYVDLTLNRPGFTAYKGRNIWRLIYLENCMGSASDNPLEKPEDVKLSIECTEEEAFHKIISGMQTVIMTLAAEYYHPRLTPMEHIQKLEDMKTRGEILDAKTFRAQYAPDLKLFKQRIAPYKEWTANLYFSFGVLLRTMCRLTPILETCSCNTGKLQDDSLARVKLETLLKVPFATCDGEFVDAPLFKRKQNLALRQFQNISRVMDCLECEKCRLHGKVKILALQLALRASGKNARVRRVERNEVIALINALDYYADAITAISRFQYRLFKLQLLWLCGLTIGSCFLIYIFNSIRKHRGQKTASTDNKTEDSDSVGDDAASTTADTAHTSQTPFTQTDSSTKPRIRIR